MLRHVLLASLVAVATAAMTAEAASPTLGPARVVVEDPRALDLATTGELHLAAWTDGLGFLYAQILRASDGEPFADPIEIAGPTVGQIAVGASGSSFLIAWIQGSAQGEVRAARVSAAGALLDPGGILVRDDVGEAHGEPISVRHRMPDVVWTGTHWYVGGSSSIPEYGESWVARMEPSGELGDRIRLGSGHAFLAAGDSSVLAAISDPDNEGHVSLRIIRSDGTAGSSSGLAPYLTVRTAPGIGGLASGGGGYAVTFAGDSDYSQQYRGLWISFFDETTGEFQRTRRFAGIHNSSIVASRDGHFFVAWDEGVEIRLVRVTTALEPVEAAFGHVVFRRASLRAVVVSNHGAFVLAMSGTSLLGRTLTY